MEMVMNPKQIESNNIFGKQKKKWEKINFKIQNLNSNIGKRIREKHTEKTKLNLKKKIQS